MYFEQYVKRTSASKDFNQQNPCNFKLPLKLRNKFCNSKELFWLFYCFTTWIKPYHNSNFTEISQFYRKKSPKTQKTWFFKLACEGPKNRKISLFFVLSAQKYPKQRLFNILGSIPNFLDIMKEPNEGKKDWNFRKI